MPQLPLNHIAQTLNSDADNPAIESNIIKPIKVSFPSKAKCAALIVCVLVKGDCVPTETEDILSFQLYERKSGATKVRMFIKDDTIKKVHGKAAAPIVVAVANIFNIRPRPDLIGAPIIICMLI